MLSTPDLNWVQDWALAYHLGLERRTQREDRDNFLDDLIYRLFPDRWKKTRVPPEIAEMAESQREHLTEEVVNSKEEADDWWESQKGRPRVMTGADLAYGGKWV